jgi:(+)-trans-carveol dehydrogenase
MKRLQGKVAVVTGAARSQGRSHAINLAREGASVVVGDIGSQIESAPYALSSAADLQETVRLVEHEDQRCIGMTADVRDSSAVDALFERAVSEFGRVDIAVSNAAIFAADLLVDMSDEQWNDVMNVNATGSFHTVRAAGRHMIEQGEGGRIICISSTAGRQGMMHFGNYAASKWAVLGLMKSASMELAPHNITVNAICPGATKTNLIFENPRVYELFCPDKENPTTADVEEVILRDLHKLPVPWIEPQDISNSVIFLASDDARYVTGMALDVNCGLSSTWSA